MKNLSLYDRRIFDTSGEKESLIRAYVGGVGHAAATGAPFIIGITRDTRQVNLDTLRDQVSYVFQEHLLMSESIRANLLLVNPFDHSAQVVYSP